MQISVLQTPLQCPPLLIKEAYALLRVQYKKPGVLEPWKRALAQRSIPYNNNVVCMLEPAYQPSDDNNDHDRYIRAYC